LVEYLVVAVNDKRHSGEVVRFGFTHREAIDVEASRMEHPSDGRQNTRLILNQSG
jgi:hypothetical protein